jgi:RNA polymerase sigma factor (sigma-70 family)
MTEPRTEPDTVDEVLLLQMAGDSYAAFTVLYQRHIRSLTLYGLKFTTDVLLVEDSLHDLFVWLWEKRKAHKIISFKSYLFKSLRTSLIRKIGKVRKTGSLEEEGDAAEGFGLTEYSAEFIRTSVETVHEQQQKLYQALSTLTARQREIIYLRYTENISFEDIAQGMDINVKACYKLMARAIAALRTEYQVKTLIIVALLKQISEIC